MALTRATKDRRLASLDAEITEARQTARRQRERAAASDARAARLAEERDWLAQAPVADPLPDPSVPAEDDQ